MWFTGVNVFFYSDVHDSNLTLNLGDHFYVFTLSIDKSRVYRLLWLVSIYFQVYLCDSRFYLSSVRL